MDGAQQEQEDLLREHITQLAEVISSLEDLAESLRSDGGDTKAVERLLEDFRQILATTIALNSAP